MDKVLSVFLCPDIDAQTCYKLAGWLSDGAVVRYMNEDSGAGANIVRLVKEVPAPMLSFHFNRGGRFFIIKFRAQSIGFVKLSNVADKEYEIVIAVGEKEMWGRGLGAAAVKEALKTAFFEWRSQTVHAKIHKNNTRSMRLFRRAGFLKTDEKGNYVLMRLSFEDYLSALKSDNSKSEKTVEKEKPENTAENIRA